MEASKICNKCKIKKQLIEFGNSKQYKDGKSYYCKECEKKTNDEYRIKNSEKIKLHKKKNYEKNKEQIIKKSKEYYYKNKEVIIERVKIYYSANKSKIKKSAKKYFKENMKLIQCRDRKRYRKNKKVVLERRKEYYSKNKEKITKYKKAYSQTEKGKAISRNKTNKRRAKYKNGDVTTDELLQLYARVKKCYWCEKKLSKNKIHMDHYVPLSKGGLHTISNIVLSCPRCNLSKNAKDPHKFAQTLGRLL